MSKKNLAMVFIFVCLVATSSAQATVISVFDIVNTVSTSGIGTAENYSLTFGIDCPLQLINANINTFGIVNEKTYNNIPIFTEMLQRTFTYSPEDRIGFTPMAEEISNYERNELNGLFILNGSIDYNTAIWQFSPIPDLSGYTINGLYAENFTTFQGSTAISDTRILADVSPVPEPSSFILLAVGIVGIVFLKRRQIGANDLIAS